MMKFEGCPFTWGPKLEWGDLQLPLWRSTYLGISARSPKPRSQVIILYDAM